MSMVSEADSTERDPIAAAHDEAEALRTPEPALGTPGPPISRRSPFMVGLLGAAGVAVTYGVVHLLVVAGDILALIGLSWFLALGLEPVVAWLTRHHLRRGLAVAIVVIVIVASVGGFIAAAIPILTAQTEAFIRHIPGYLAEMKDHSTTLGKLDERLHLQDRLSQLTKGGAPTLMRGLLTAGEAVLTITVSSRVVLVLTVYLLVEQPRLRRLTYRLVPASRRPRVILIGDEVTGKVGAYVLGNLATSAIASAGTLVWLVAWGIPYPFLLAIMVGIFDLIPIVGSTAAGAVVSLVALTVSLPVALATLGFYVGYRYLEDYLIVPKIIGRTVQVPATTTLIAVLFGGAALGLLGALIAIPVAAAIDIVLRETVFPRLDRT
jgi:predicted PurR-regulated permease PerM